MVVGMRGIGWSHFGLGPNSEVRPEQIRYTQKPPHISQKKTGLGPVSHLAHPPLWESCENEAKVKRSEGAFCARHGTPGLHISLTCALRERAKTTDAQ